MPSQGREVEEDVKGVDSANRVHARTMIGSSNEFAHLRSSSQCSAYAVTVPPSIILCHVQYKILLNHAGSLLVLSLKTNGNWIDFDRFSGIADTFSLRLSPDSVALVPIVTTKNGWSIFYTSRGPT